MAAHLVVGDESATGASSLGSSAPAPEPSETATPSAPEPFELRGLLLLDSAGNPPVVVHALAFGDDGIGLVGRQGDAPRVLPWSSVSAHAVEPWAGGPIPEWWVDPGLPPRSPPHGRTEEANGHPLGAVEPVREPAIRGGRDRRGGHDRRAGHRSLPHVEAGALIDIRTPSGTFRFLLPHADPGLIAVRITSIAVRHRGLSGASSVTTALGVGARRSLFARLGRPGTVGWARVQPVFVMLLMVVIAAAVTLILLQSAGAVHLPFLGGAGSTGEGLPAPPGRGLPLPPVRIR